VVRELRRKLRILAGVTPPWPNGIGAASPRYFHDQIYVCVIVPVTSSIDRYELIRQSNVFCVRRDIFRRRHAHKVQNIVRLERFVRPEAKRPNRLHRSQSIVGDENLSYRARAASAKNERLERSVEVFASARGPIRVRAVARGAHDGKTGERRDFVSSHFVRDFVHRTRAAD